MAKISAYLAKVANTAGNIEYTADEDAVWRDLYAQQLPNIRTLCAKEYLSGFDTLGLPANRVPQCPEVSDRLRALTGWRVEPVPALIGFKQFFTMLANQTFPAASFIRNRADFDYIEEPDIFHEIFGHTPLLTDQRFANFSQAIGEAGQAASSKDHAWLIRLYWFTIEFGLTRDGDAFKALGSGLASSPTELPHSVHGADVIRREFNIMDILRTPYRIDIHQPIYFVLDDIDTLLQAAERDLIADVHAAQDLGLFAPAYPEKKKVG